MKELEGKTALITGASRGIGVYIARAMAQKKMNLVLSARSAEGLEKVATELRSGGTQVHTIPTDVGKRDQLEALAVEAEKAFGGVDILVNNAGLEKAFPYHQASIEVIDQIIEVNLTAPMILSRLLLPKMIERGSGHIVNIASLAGLLGAPYQEAYSATKHGLVGFTRSLVGTAIGENYPVGISVICPGFVSEAGMYHNMTQETGLKAPASFGTSTPGDVVKAVMLAIHTNKTEIIVNPKPIKPMLYIQVFSPGLTRWLLQKLGGLELFKRAVHLRNKEKAAVS